MVLPLVFLVLKGRELDSCPSGCGSNYLINIVSQHQKQEYEENANLIYKLFLA